MANDQDKQMGQDKQSGQPGQRREIGEGMHSLDSTQAPLKAETGEPDYDAMTDHGKSKKNADESNDGTR